MKIFFYLSFIWIICLNINDSFAINHKELCESISKWKAFSDVRKNPGIKSYEEKKLGKVIDPKFLIDKIKKNGWVVIDARDQVARKIFGIVSNSFLITSDPKDKSKDQFEEKKLLERFNTPSNIEKLKARKISPINDIEVLKNVNFVIFCNGFSCHRSSWAACKLRDLGIPFKNINLLLSGYASLEEYNRKHNN